LLPPFSLRTVICLNFVNTKQVASRFRKPCTLIILKIKDKLGTRNI